MNWKNSDEIAKRARQLVSGKTEVTAPWVREQFGIPEEDCRGTRWKSVVAALRDLGFDMHYTKTAVFRK